VGFHFSCTIGLPNALGFVNRVALPQVSKMAGLDRDDLVYMAKLAEQAER